MQHLLDIDLDFFLADCCPLAAEGQRPSLFGHEPWEKQRVSDFLEQNCGLSKEKKIKGRIFETHDKALIFWQELMKKGLLSAPFSVTHIDAHSDLGIGDPGPGFVLSTVISTRLDKRCDTDRYYGMKQLDEANYLLFAVGMRYVGELINVRNPRSRQDFPQEVFIEDEDGKRCAIFLSSFASRLLESVNGKEPVIPYAEYADYTQYRAKEPFDFASLAISPRYAPKEADELLDVFSDYFELI